MLLPTVYQQCTQLNNNAHHLPFPPVSFPGTTVWRLLCFLRLPWLLSWPTALDWTRDCVCRTWGEHLLPFDLDLFTCVFCVCVLFGFILVLVLWFAEFLWWKDQRISCDFSPSFQIFACLTISLPFSFCVIYSILSSVGLNKDCYRLQVIILVSFMSPKHSPILSLCMSVHPHIGDTDWHSGVACSCFFYDLSILIFISAFSYFLLSSVHLFEQQPCDVH